MLKRNSFSSLTNGTPPNENKSSSYKNSNSNIEDILSEQVGRVCLIGAQIVISEKIRSSYKQTVVLITGKLELFFQKSWNSEVLESILSHLMKVAPVLQRRSEVLMRKNLLSFHSMKERRSENISFFSEKCSNSQHRRAIVL